ncbi:LCP family protein [Patescibacteria group bacterium]|nr:LCP family protein [Patescibacteria group bacterium]
MNSFRTRKIRQKPPLRLGKKLKDGILGCFRFIISGRKRHWSYVFAFLLLLLGALVVFKVTGGLYRALQDFEPEDMVLALGSELKQDEYGYTNMVLLGDGGHVRDGADLIDTIMVASINLAGKTVSIFSIPRDYYVWSDEYGDAKINELYRNNKNRMGEEGAFDAFKDVAGQVTNLDIHYYARVDFNAFVDVVDSLGGIAVDVKEPIYDPYYPNETDDGYTVFEMDAGLQEMDGEIALKFVRSRKTTSDFDRAARQQQVLMAIQDKALSSGVLKANTVKKLYQSLKDNVNTDLTIREMIAMASFAKNFDRKNMVSKVIHDDPSRDGGFLYTPERKYYNGQFVLVPDGDNMDFLHQYADLIFHHQDVLINPVRIEILNATKEAGVARLAASHLNRFGFDIVDVDNLFDEQGGRKYVEKSFIRYNHWEVDAEGNVIPRDQSTLDALSNFVKGEFIPSSQSQPEDEVDISIVLGKDYEIY